MIKPETIEAVRLVRDEGLTPYAAAKRTGVAQSTVHRALEREDHRCEACGQVVRKGGEYVVRP